MENKLLLASFRNVFLAGAYIFGVSQFMFYAEKLFQAVGDNNLAPFAFLLLFSLSAAVVGSLIFGQAVLLFFENKKAECVKAVFYSVGWLFLLTLVVIGALAVISRLKPQMTVMPTETPNVQPITSANIH